MEIIIEATKEMAADKIVEKIVSLVNIKKYPVISLPSGKTPLIVYQKMAEAYKRGEVDFSETLVLALDEFLGIPHDHPCSTFSYFQENLINQTNIDPRNIYLIDGRPTNLKSECRRVEEQIRDLGGIDIQILGIGRDGHIGFNEPGYSLTSRTRVKPLAQSTRDNLVSLFGAPEKVPPFCITLGIGTIMEADQVALLAFGNEKATAIKRCVEGPICSAFPASILQMHPEAELYIDEEAASLLEQRDFYKWAHESKSTIEEYMAKAPL